MTSTLRIVHAMTPATVGGLETAVRSLAAGQVARGHDVHVVATLDSAAEPSVLHDLRDSGVAVTTVVAPGRAYAREWRALQAAFAAFQPDVVHTHGYRADLLAGTAARRAGFPVATTLHGFVGGDWKLRVYETLQRRSLRSFDAVVAVSARMGVELARRVEPAKLHVIPNAYASAGTPLSRAEARAALGIPDDRFQIGWIGRLSPEKGPDVMIRAMAAGVLSDLHLSVVGDGMERERVEALTRELGVRRRVRFHGVRDNASALLAAFDVVVLSSRSEGTPIVLLEAMAARVPVVATRVGGIPDVVQDEHALLVSSEDVPALAAAIANVRDDPAASANRTECAAVRLAEHYDVKPWVAAYDRVYGAIAHRSGATSGATSGVTNGRLVA